jgi:hypothetical protein
MKICQKDGLTSLPNSSAILQTQDKSSCVSVVSGGTCFNRFRVFSGGGALQTSLCQASFDSGNRDTVPNVHFHIYFWSTLTGIQKHICHLYLWPTFFCQACHDYISKICKKINNQFRQMLSATILLRLYKAFILPHL